MTEIVIKVVVLLLFEVLR